MASKPPVPPKRYLSQLTAEESPPSNGEHITFLAKPAVAQSVTDIKKFDIQGLKLPALAAVQVKVRRLTVNRNLAGDFGFSIRRVQYPTGVRGELRTVVFVEPTNVTPGLPRPDDIRNKLLPGDELLEINDKNVSQLSRDELHDAVRSAGSSVSLLVKTAPELAEYCDKHTSGVRDRGDTILLSNVNTSVVEDISEDSRYWLIHKGGYALVRLEGFEQDGRVRVSVAGQRMVVDTTDVDRANPIRFDRAADLSALPFLNETSTIHLLRQRLGSNLLYTNAGAESVICLLNNGDGPSVTDDGLVSIFKGCRRGHMPSHIYGTAQQLYRQIQMTGRDQAIVLTGASGGGKSMQLRSLVRYLAHVAGWTKHLSYERLTLFFGVIEAFGNSATVLNPSSTRFAALFSLGFDKAASLRAVRVQTGLLEADRVMRREHGEHLFHVFYYMLEGADEALKERLQLKSLPESTIVPFRKAAERENATLAWQQLLSALNHLGFNQEKIGGICSILGALLHLHAAGATPGSAQKSHFLRAANAQIAANLMGIPVDALANALFRGKLPNANPGNVLGNTLNRLSFTSRGPDGPEALVSFGAALYEELFTEIIDSINKMFASNSAFSWLSILDIPGSTFHADWTEKRISLGLRDLTYNYVNERIAELFYDFTFTEPQEVYSRENVDVNVQQPLRRPHEVTRLMDQKQQLLTSTDIDERAEERRGLFAILEEEALFPGASDESLVQRIFVHLGDDNRLLNHGDTSCSMVISHGMGAYQAKYNVDGWVKMAQPCEGATLVRPLLSSTTCSLINSFFPTTALPIETSRLRRATQVAQMELMSKRSSSGLFGNMQGQLEHLLKSVKRAARVHFVHCILPTTSSMRTSEIVDVPFVRCQLRTVQLIEAVRANNRGYTERLSFRDFRRRFSCLAGKSADSLDALDDRAAAEDILVNCDIHQHRYRLGISQLLLASDLLVELEDKRELSLSGLIESLQRECRRHLATKWLQKRRMMDAAIRCIQRNGNAYMKTRSWPWWKLYTRVVPLVLVARSDTDITGWRRRVEDLMQQVQELRSSKSKAERKVDELEQTLSEHANTANVLTTALDRETENRVHLERRIQVLAEQANSGGSVSRVSSMAKIEGFDDREKMEMKNHIIQLRTAEEEAKIKAQKAVAQLQDVEEQLNSIRARNEVLEKKQNRFDADMEVLKEQVLEERLKRERIESERDELKTAGTRKAADLQASKSEVTELRAVVSRLRRETEARDSNAGDDQLAQVQKVRRELEQRVQAQETELNELADQNHILQQTVTRLEMSHERVKTDLTRETASRETELDELQSQYQRRIRGMEEQIADANEKYQNVLAENRVIVARIRQKDIPTPSEGGQYKRELRKALALLADTQAVLAHEREAAPSQAIMRQLRNQIEDVEAAKTSALKGKHNLESELNELRALLEATLTAKTQLEERCLNLLRDKNAGCALVEEKDEQLQSVLKKYKAALQQNHIDHITIADQIEQMSDLENSKHKLELQVNELETELEWLRQHTVEKHKLILCEQKLKDKENMLELETAHKLRLESIVVKLTDEVEALTEQTSDATHAREREQENSKKVKRDLVNLQESIEEMKKKEIDSSAKTKSARSETEQLEEQLKASQAELKLSLKRIDALQAALSEGLDVDDEESDEEDLGTGMSML